MFRFNDREALRRWIAEAGMICVGAGVLWTSGCAGAARDGLAAGGSTSAKAGTQIASTEKPGHASLSDRRSSTANRRPDRQTAARKRPARTSRQAGDPFLTDAPAVAQQKTRPPQSRPAQPAQSSGGTAVANAKPTPKAQVPPAKPTVAANSRVIVPSVTPKKPAAAQRALAESATGSRPSQRTIAQASAKVPADTQRPKLPEIAPVITPAAPSKADTDVASTSGYERQRADRLMERAHLMLTQNFREEALRLAAVAEQLEKSRQAIYLPGEERPSELVAQLQQSTTDGQIDLPATATAKATGTTPATAEIDTARRTARWNRSQPSTPIAVGVKRGKVELTDIRAGWHATGEAEEANPSGIERTTAEATDAAGQTQIAHLETRAASESQVKAVPPSTETSVAAPAPPEVIAKNPAPAPAVATAANDIAEVEPVTTSEAAPSRSPVNTATMGGLAAGLAGLLGLAFWRRQERKHYAGAKR